MTILTFIAQNQRRDYYRRTQTSKLYFLILNIFKRIYNYFIINEFKLSNKHDLINRKINFHHSRKFHDNVLKYLRKYIKDLRRNIFAINVVNEFNRCFIYVYRTY